jgi:sulfate/thiosulfate transport system substrate-binding protein
MKSLIALNKIFFITILFFLTILNFNCGKSGDKPEGKEITLLNVSYDPTRELYEEFNKEFIKYLKDKTGQIVTINQSHGGAGKQARSVIDGVEADVITLALAYDIDAISDKAGLLDKEWQKEFPHNSSPYTSTMVFIVRKGNPKKIKNWDDLTRKDLQVITPNPKTSGGARWNYLAAWAYASKKFNKDEKKIREFISKILKNVPVWDTGARGSTNTFVQREIGDVLINWENEAILITEKFGKDKFEIVYPTISILAEPPVAIIDKIVDKRGTREAATEYLNYLYSDIGQDIAARNFYRPTDKEILEKYKSQFPDLELVNINDEFGGWQKAQKTHFLDGGTFDQLSK